jgi:hypothetical protein
VRIGNSDIHARTTAVLDDSTSIDDGSVLTADGLLKFRDGATLTEEAGNGSTELAGTPLLSGLGTFRWLSGAVTGKLTVRAPMHLEVTGTANHTLNNAVAGPLTVEPGATALQRGTGPITLGVSARISNQGTWRVRTFDARIAGVSCCAVTARFDNQGYLELEGGRTLTVASMDFLQRPSGTVRPFGDGSGGTLVVDGGANEVRGGALNDVRVLLTGNGGLAVAGHAELLAHASIRQTDSVDVSGAATFTGNGTYRWSDGTVTGQLTFGTDTHFLLDDPATGGARKYLYPDDHPALLDLRGDSTFDSAMPLVVSSTSTKVGRIVNAGTLTWRAGAIDYAGVPGALVNHGVLDLRSRLTLGGRFSQDSGGAVRVVIAGQTPSTRGQLVASGALDLDGQLRLVRVGNTAVNGYSLLTGASRSGRFHSVLGSIPGLVVAYRTKAVVLTER